MACEGLVIGGISLYFSKQIKELQKEVEELKGIIAKNQGANEKRFEVIFNFLDTIGNPQPQQPIKQPVEVKKQVEVKQKVKGTQGPFKETQGLFKKQEKKVQFEEPKKLEKYKKPIIKTEEEPSVLNNSETFLTSQKDEVVIDVEDDLDGIEEEHQSLLDETVDVSMSDDE